MCVFLASSGDLTPQVGGLSGCFGPPAVALRGLFEACDALLRGSNPSWVVLRVGVGTWKPSHGLERAVRLFEFVGVEAGTCRDDGLLPCVEFGERVVVEVVEVAGEVLVGEASGVVPRCPGRQSVVLRGVAPAA
jgi:hypothetical protein